MNRTDTMLTGTVFLKNYFVNIFILTVFRYLSSLSHCPSFHAASTLNAFTLFVHPELKSKKKQKYRIYSSISHTRV